MMEQLQEHLIKGKSKELKELVEKALQENLSPADILNQGLLAGMNKIGERFKKNEVYVPEVLIAARAMKTAMEVLKPSLAKAGVEPLGTVVVGTVKGDLHDIGKNLVCMMLEGGGFKVIDAGINIEASKFIQLAEEHHAALIGASALLTTTMINMKELVEAVKASVLAGKVKVMIGGAPTTQAFADEIGADGYAPDAASAVDTARKLIGL